MKKFVPILAVLGSAVAFAVYKMKKEEQKQLVDLDEGLLEEDEPDFHHNDPEIYESTQPDFPSEDASSDDGATDIPIAKEIEPQFAQSDKAVEVTAEDIQQLFKETAEETKEAFNDGVEKVSEVVEDIKETIEDHIEEATETLAEVEETFSEAYPHLTNRMVEDINTMVKEAIEKLAKDGDVHEHERPVQHMVSFQNKEDMESFKSRVINKGFVITKGEKEFDLVVLHISAIDEEKLINHILYIADQAYAFNGEYQGWQSKVSF